VTKLDEILMQQIAAAGKGSYVRASFAETGLNTIFDEISKMEKKEYESKVFSDFEDRFQYFIAIALLLLIIEITIFERKNKWFSKFNPFIKDSFLLINKK
jgi:Ca-activated chloride channel family protein